MYHIINSILVIVAKHTVFSESKVFGFSEWLVLLSESILDEYDDSKDFSFGRSSRRGQAFRLQVLV